jgi:hypothetical protein
MESFRSISIDDFDINPIVLSTAGVSACIAVVIKSKSLRNSDDRESSTSQISLIFLYVIGSSEVSSR